MPPKDVDAWVDQAADRLPLSPNAKKQIADQLHAGIARIHPQERSERAMAARDEAWRILLNARSTSEQMESALSAATDADSIAPDQFVMITLRGFALFRLGRFQESSAELLRAQSVAGTSRRPSGYNMVFMSSAPTAVVANLAVLAMARFKLDQPAEANLAISQLRTAMSEPFDPIAPKWIKDALLSATYGTDTLTEIADTDSKALLAEAEALIDPPAGSPR